MPHISNPSEWCIEQHSKTNHFYDEFLPYEFHLRMVHNVAKQFESLLKVDAVEKNNVFKACWGHDLIEDCRVSFNDAKEALGEQAAEIIYAVTNEKGKTRKDRANDNYYKGIRETKHATFVKLCDRIANVQYSKLMKSRMFDLYKNELDQFTKQLGWDGNESNPYYPMFIYLSNLFEG